MARFASPKFRSFLAIIGIGFIGGAISPYAIKILRINFGPFTIVFWRFFLAAICFLPLVNWKQINWRKSRQLIFLSVFYFANIVLFSWGIKYTTGIASQLLYVLSPILVLLGAFFMLGEKISKSQLLGSLISFVGVLLLLAKSINPDTLNSLGTFKGNLAILTAVVCWSLFTVESRRYLKGVPSQEITLFAFLVTAFLSLPLMIWETRTSSFLAVNTEQILILVILGLVCSIGFLVLQQYALAHVKAFYVSFSTFLGVFFTCFTGLVFFNEKISWALGLGLILIVFGSLLVVLYSRK